MNGSLTAAQWETLLACPLLDGAAWLTAALQEALEDGRCRRQRYAKGSVIFAGTHFERALGFLLTGQLRVVRINHDGREMLISRQTPGAVFGAAVLFCDAEIYPTELRCSTVCEVLFVPEALLREWMRQDFRLAENYIRYLSGRISFLNSKIGGLAAGDSVRRLSRWLTEHAQNGTVTLPAMASLASALNIGRASLYRAVETLESEGVIRRSGHTVLLLQPDSDSPD